MPRLLSPYAAETAPYNLYPTVLATRAAIGLLTERLIDLIDTVPGTPGEEALERLTRATRLGELVLERSVANRTVEPTIPLPTPPRGYYYVESIDTRRIITKTTRNGGPATPTPELIGGLEPQPNTLTVHYKAHNPSHPFPTVDVTITSDGDAFSDGGRNRVGLAPAPPNESPTQKINRYFSGYEQMFLYARSVALSATTGFGLDCAAEVKTLASCHSQWVGESYKQFGQARFS